MKNILLAFIVVFFLGCSSREYFKPTKNELSNQTIYVTKSLPSNIVFFTNKTATISNHIVLPENYKLPKNFVSIDKNLAKNGSKLWIKGGKILSFKQLIVTAKKRKNLIAIILGNNSFKLYNLKQNKVVFSYNFGQFLAVRKFVAQPYFYKGLLLIPTLDGSLGIFDIKSNKLIRTVVVTRKDYFNNIIYLGVQKDNLVVASRDNIILIAPGVTFSKSFDIKHILVNSSGIYVFSVNGTVYKLNFSLKVIKKIDFKYANIIAPTIVGNNIYFVESGDGEYLIKMTKNLTNPIVYPLHSENLMDVNTFTKNGVLYIGDKFINLKDIK